MQIDHTGSTFLAALQLADSFFPTGMYAHSHGLESMVARGWIKRPDDVAQYLHNLLTWSILPCDGVALLNAHRAARYGDLETLTDIDWHLHAMKLPEELRLASCHAGRRILDETASLMTCDSGASISDDYRQLVLDHTTPGTGAVALGVVAHAFDIAADNALLMHCHSFAVGMLGAAQRLLPLTHSEAQRILLSLQEPTTRPAADLSARDWREMTSFSPQADIASMLHAHDDVRMFAS